ncbi:hypothetical protein D3C72_741340 [compost metagenome]
MDLQRLEATVGLRHGRRANIAARRDVLRIGVFHHAHHRLLVQLHVDVLAGAGMDLHLVPADGRDLAAQRGDWGGLRLRRQRDGEGCNDGGRYGADYERALKE